MTGIESSGPVTLQVRAAIIGFRCRRGAQSHGRHHHTICDGRGKGIGRGGRDGARGCHGRILVQRRP